MVEKTIKLENLPLLEFLGVENSNIRLLVSHYPDIKLTSRGDVLWLKGKIELVEKVSELIQKLIEHYIRYGELTTQQVSDYLHENESDPQREDKEVILHGIKGLPVKPKSANQAKIVKAIEEKDLVFAMGPAGTGKTFISVALAVRALKNKEVRKIVLTRPAVEAGENLGFLPGDLKEKIDPYIRPIYDALEEMIPSEKLKMYQETGVIEIAPLAFMRGRTLANSFILLDEAQNTTPMQLKMFLTRMGNGSKMIITGDKTQIDLPVKQRSGLLDALSILQDLKGVAFVELDGKDVTRHPLVRDIIKAYDHASKKPLFE